MTDLEKSQIREKIKKGDYLTIEKMTAYSYIMIRSVINGRRNNNEIWEAAKTLTTTREGMILNFKKQKK